MNPKGAKSGKSKVVKTPGGFSLKSKGVWIVIKRDGSSVRYVDWGENGRIDAGRDGGGGG